jgi:hypothetical protein
MENVSFLEFLVWYFVALIMIGFLIEYFLYQCPECKSHNTHDAGYGWTRCYDCQHEWK